MGRLESNARIYRHIQVLPMLYTNKTKVIERKRLRRSWHRLRTPEIKRLLNAATQALKQLFLSNKNSLWKTIKKIKEVKEYSAQLRTPQGTWVRTNFEKAHTLYTTTLHVRV
jgi:hypothetical protein